MEILMKALILLVFILSSFSDASLIGEASCKLVDCGQGVCNGSADDKLPFFFECECHPGWTQFKILDRAILPGCTIPNCTLGFNCGLPLLPSLALPTNLSDPCSFTWCGNGTCTIADGGGHKCDCNEGAFNLLNMPSMPCFQECYLGSDCNGLSLDPPPPSSKLPAPLPSAGTWNSPRPTARSSGSCKVMKWIETLGYLVSLMSLQQLV